MQDVGADDEAFEDDDQAVEAENEAEAPPVVVVGGDGYGDHGADEGDHASEGGDDLQEAAEDRPEGRPWDADEFEAYEPEDAYDERIEGGCAPPVDERAAGGF